MKLVTTEQYKQHHAEVRNSAEFNAAVAPLIEKRNALFADPEIRAAHIAGKYCAWAKFGLVASIKALAEQFSIACWDARGAVSEW